MWCPFPPFSPSHLKRHWTLFSHIRNVTMLPGFCGGCCLFSFFFIFTRAFSRIVISGRELGKAKKINEVEEKSALSLSKLLVPEAAEVSDLIADSENGPLWHCTACVKHHRSPDCPGYVAILSSLWKQKWTAEHRRKKKLLGTKLSALMIYLVWRTDWCDLYRHLWRKGYQKHICQTKCVPGTGGNLNSFFRKKSFSGSRRKMMVREYQKKSLRDWFLSPPVQLLHGLAVSNQMPNSVLCICPADAGIRGVELGLMGPAVLSWWWKPKVFPVLMAGLQRSTENWVGTSVLIQSLFTQNSHWF